MGDTLAAKYRVERVLGVGGMGVVVAARHVALHELFAVKLLLPEALRHGDSVPRFLREARAAVRLKGEHIARVHDVGATEAGQPYMVMEYLEGDDLGAVLTRRGSLPIELAVEYAAQACEGIAEAHALGVTHRDLKPGNLFLTRRPNGSACVKVLDFGISKLSVPFHTASDVGVTTTGAVMGSPLYMSPEQLRASRDVDARSDVWALGVVLFELLTGRAPFDADAVTEILAKILTEDAPRLRDLRPDVPADLDAVVDRCLQKNPPRRFANAAALAAALEPMRPRLTRPSLEFAVDDEPTQAATVGPMQPTVPMSTLQPTKVDTSPSSTWGRTQRFVRPRDSRRVVLLIVAGSVLLASLVIAAVSRSTGPSAATSDAPPSSQAAPEAALPTAAASPMSAATGRSIDGAAAPPTHPSADPSAKVVPTSSPATKGAAALPPAPSPGRPRDFGPRK